MNEIVALLQSIAPVISTTTLRQLSQVVYGMLISNGRITMLELSRWTEKGGSYRTIQRLYHTPILWLQIQWILFTSQFHQTDREYIAAGDEVVFGKAGKETHGLGRFFSSLQNRVIPGLSFFVFSLIDVQERQSYPIQAVQIIKEPKQPKKKEKDKPPQAKKRPIGRPKGSKNKKKEPPVLSPELLRIQPILQAFLAVLKGILTVRHLVMDGHFGNYPSAWMVLQTGLQLVSKLRFDAALYEPFAGKYRGRGPHPTYGDKVDVRKMKKKYLKADDTEAGIRTQIYQAALLNHEFVSPINVVVILKTNLSFTTGQNENYRMRNRQTKQGYDLLWKM
jgi:putative transposase